MPDHIAAARAAADQIDAHWRDAVVIGVVLDDEDAAAIDAVCDELEREQEKVRRLTEDWADDDTAIREACRAVLGDEVDGDREYRPAMAELCERVCNSYAACAKIIESCACCVFREDGKWSVRGSQDAADGESLVAAVRDWCDDNGVEFPAASSASQSVGLETGRAGGARGL